MDCPGGQTHPAIWRAIIPSFVVIMARFSQKGAVKRSLKQKVNYLAKTGGTSVHIFRRV